MARHHDPDIPEDTPLYRRIPWQGGRVTWDEQGNPFPTKSNFQDANDELSLYIAAETTEEWVLAGHDGFGLISITFAQIRAVCLNENGQSVVIICRDVEDPGNGHVLVCGRITNGMAKRLQHASWQWVRWPRREPPET